MTTYERINEIKNTTIEQQTVREDYLNLESELINQVGEFMIGAEVECSAYGSGKVTAYEGERLNNMIIDVAFAEVAKQFSLQLTMANNFVKFVRADEIRELWDLASEVHTKLTAEFNALERANEQAKKEAAKKAEAEKKAEAKYQRLKEKSIKDFDELVNQAKASLSDVDEFYYALGWLAKHAGTVSAALPDYLEDAFTKYFGTETGCRIVDSKHRGPAGWQAQWSWSFKVTLKKFDSVPCLLTKYLNPAGKAITNTSFIWDLIDNYGFQFGKKQDVDKIREIVPTQYINFFETGYTA